MTLSGIIRQAMMQLGEAQEDAAEYEELFRAYANAGYRIALDQYLMPRETRMLAADGQGNVRFDPREIARVVEIYTTDRTPRKVRFILAKGGKTLTTDARNCALLAICEVHRADMEEATDEPVLPSFAHAALADYICYRHLSNGNLAKQSRAQFYRNSFYEAMNRIRPDGYGSVTAIQNLYRATEG